MKNQKTLGCFLAVICLIQVGAAAAADNSSDARLKKQEIDETLTALARQLVAEQSESDAAGSSWSGTFTLRGEYDHWNNDSAGDESGRQFTETGQALVFTDSLFLPGDFFYFYGEASGIQSTVDQGGMETTLIGTTDTLLLFSYSTFDYTTSGVEVTVDVNVPTGETELTALERLSTPNPNVVSKPFGGAGFNAGFVAKYLTQWTDALQTYAGAGYGYKGSYDPTAELSGDDVSSGHELRARLGGEYLVDERISLDLGLSFNHVIGYGDEDANSLGVRPGISAEFDPVLIEFNYSFNYSDATNNRTTDIYRSDDYRQGLTHEFMLRGECECWDDVTLGAFGDYFTSSRKRSMDATFFPTDDKLEFGLDGEWNVPDWPLTLAVGGKYFLVTTQGLNQGQVDFSGFSANGSVAVRF